MTRWKTCRRQNCDLTALWQCCIDAQILGRCQHKLITNLVVCGLHKDEVEVIDFDTIIDRVDPERDHHFTLYWADISEGVWVNPKTRIKEKYL